MINKIIIREKYRDYRGRDRMVDLQLPMYSVLIATKNVECLLTNMKPLVIIIFTLFVMF
jgi:hypothetical protein